MLSLSLADRAAALAAVKEVILLINDEVIKVIVIFNILAAVKETILLINNYSNEVIRIILLSVI